MTIRPSAGPAAARQFVTVTPLDAGWCVASSLTDLPLVFFSGADAELSARRLAHGFARSGKDAHVIIRDRRNVQIGTVCYFAAEDEDPPTLAASGL